MRVISNDWTELAVKFTQERMNKAHAEAMEEMPDARRVLTYLRGCGAGKFGKSELSAILGVNEDVIESVCQSLNFEHYTDDGGIVRYIFNSDHFQKEPDRVLQVIEDENAELKAENKRLKALVTQCDTDHAETLQKYERLNIYVAAVRDVLIGYPSHTNCPGQVVQVVKELLFKGCEPVSVHRFLTNAINPPVMEVEEDDDDYDGYYDDDDPYAPYDDDPDDWY